MQIGDIVAARYRLNKQHQVSWQSVRVDDGLLCVLKPDHGFVDPDIAAWLGTIWHPGLPHFHETIQADDRQCYHVFDFMPGQSLENLAQAIGGRIEVGQLMPVMIEIAGILSFLHQQSEPPVLHLDIKPGNIIVAPDGQVGLIDFDAAILGQDKGCDQKMRALTPEYAAPEQLAGHPVPGSDLYALGLTMLVLLSGRSPAECRNLPPADLLPDTEPWLVGMLGRCLHADPDSRYQKADELVRDLVARTVHQPERPDSSCQIEPDLPFAVNGTDQPFVENGTNQPDHQPLSDNQTFLPSPLISIWDGADFGCEFAAVLAKTRQVLVIDADLLNPRADLLLGIHAGNDHLFREEAVSGLDRAIMEEQRGHLNAILLEHLAQPTRIENLRMLATQGNLDYFEHYQMESLHQIIKAARLISELVIILCNRSIYDTFTCLGLLEADRVLIPIEAESGAFREINRAVRFMEIRHQLDRSRLHYVAFPYDARTDLSRGTMDELCDGRLAGCIAASQKRRAMKSGARPYAACLDRDIHRDYLQLIQTIQLPGSPGSVLAKPAKPGNALARPGQSGKALAKPVKPGKVG